MKKMKKIFSLMLAMVMVFSMTATVFAEEEATTYTITVPAVKAGETAHTYEVYQIFTGTISDEKLIDVKWGQNGKGTEGEAVDDATIEALEAVVGKSDSAKLAVITSYADLDETAYGKVASGDELSSVPAGYYLIKDTDGSLTGKDAAYTTYIVKVVNDVTVTPKSAKPTVDKQVYDNDDKVATGDNNGWGETADHAINETFQFKLIATLTADTNYDAYETYKVVFNDTMSDGVTFESIESVTVDGVAITDYDYVCTATEGQAGGSWTLTIANIKAYTGVNLTDGAIVEVIYNAHLNDAADVNITDGATTNKNTVKLQYSNNPNVGGEEELELGTTPEDHVWVFTYEVDNTKYKDEVNDENVLAGAGFTLYDSTGAAVKLYLKDDVYYVYSENAGDVKVITEMTSQTDGTFNIKGLDVGTYTLEETTVPAGYNKCDPITVVITATHTEEASGDAASTTLTNSKNMNNDIVNKSGTVLPETGGMGTTIFYVVGVVLVLGAGILLVTKRRMSAR